MTKKSSLKVLCVLVLAVALVFALGSTALAASTDADQACLNGTAASVKVENPAAKYWAWTASRSDLGTAISGTLTANSTGAATLSFTAALPSGTQVEQIVKFTFTALDSAKAPITTVTPVERTVTVYPVPTLGKAVTTGTMTGPMSYASVPSAITVLNGEGFTLNFPDSKWSGFTIVEDTFSGAAIFDGDFVLGSNVDIKAVGTRSVRITPYYTVDNPIYDESATEGPASKEKVNLPGATFAITFTSVAPVYVTDYTVAEKVTVGVNTVVNFADYVKAVPTNATAAGQGWQLVLKDKEDLISKLADGRYVAEKKGETLVQVIGAVYNPLGNYAGKGTVLTATQISNLGLVAADTGWTWISWDIALTVGDATVGPTDPTDPTDPVDPPDTGDAFPIWIALMGVAAIAAGTFAVKKVRA